MSAKSCKCRAIGRGRGRGRLLLSTGFGIMILVQVLMLFLELGASEASAVTDPKEVVILRSLSEKMGVVTLWNLDTDPCTTSPSTNDSYGGSYLGCDCSFDNGNTCHVTNIAIYRMNVKSELPAEIGGLKYLTFLDVNGNDLNGQIPPELGNLKNLTHLGLGTNRFIGELPPELGNIVQLRDLFLDTNQLSGEIPSTLANLRKLQTLWMFNNNFSGSIPDIFGNLTELQELRIYGNPLQGPLPQSIKDLKSLAKMYVGDVSNGGSFPYGLENLRSITALYLGEGEERREEIETWRSVSMSLRNCELYGSISTKLSQLTYLTFLDLSFNRLIGRIPHTFGNLVSLQTLYLGRNNLSGGLPQELGKLSSLKYLDVSYNQLSGALPSWLNSPHINVNLVWNFFNGTNTVNVFSASYFNCHLSNTSCQRTLPGNNSGFAINVGGKEVKTSTSIYDDDSKVHGYTSFYTNDKRTWAVSQTGGFDQGNFLDIVNTTSKIQGTHDPSLYQTAHSSSSSLKYYGLEMKNGQYMVDLHFAEIVLTDGSLGTRIFDIFIQGVLIQKDFNIQDAADGSLKALVLSIPVMVSNNYLEIHFFWDGKGTCCYPRRWAYGPLISAIRVYPASQVKQGQTLAIVFSSFGAVLIALCLIAAWYWRVNNNPSILSTEDQAVRSFELQQGVNLFSYRELKTATNDFSALNKLGEGGFGAVYKGVLSDGTQIAVKMLSSRSRQGDREFLNEVGVISSVQQRNLVKLRGCCVEEGSRILVYEFIENNSLSQALFGKIPKNNAQGAVLLNWSTRFNIALGIARGLAYLHEESETRIIHRDIKASNILLDKNFNAKIADFGLARFFDDEKTHVSTRVAGTIGYMAPEYAFRGQLSEKADVFGYGVLMLEIFSGRSNIDLSLPDEQSLLEWAWNLYENNQILGLMDSRLNGEFPNDIALRVLEVSLMCTQAAPSARPSMGRVVAMLLGDVKVPPLESKPVYVTDVRLQKTTANAIQSVGSNSNSASIATFSTVVESR